MELTFESIRDLSTYIRTFGVWAPLVAFILFAVQAALPVFPYIILAAAGGILFGFKMGFFLSWLGALFGACIAYWFCRWLGYERLQDYLENRFRYRIPNLNNGAAWWSILIARIIPVVPTPLINIVAAISGVPFWTFFTSSAIGKIPTAVLYTGFGLALFNMKDIKTALYLIGGLLLLVVLARYFGRRYAHFLVHSDNKQNLSE